MTDIGSHRSFHRVASSAKWKCTLNSEKANVRRIDGLYDGEGNNPFRRPITLPKLKFMEPCACCGSDIGRDQSPVLLSASRKAVTGGSRLQKEKQALAAREIEGDDPSMAESEPGENPRDLVALFAETEAEYSTTTKAGQRRDQS